MKPQEATVRTPATDRVGAAGKYLTFILGDEEYGLEILKVREIFGTMPITFVPRLPPYVRGVINLRGQVIAVVDLRTKFGMPEVPPTAMSCIIVVELHHDGRKVDTGIVVDKVSEVLSISGEQIEPPPVFGERIDTEFILGMGKVGQSVKILLDIGKVLSIAELGELQSVVTKAAA